METDGKEGVSPLTEYGADPLEYARIIVPLPETGFVPTGSNPPLQQQQDPSPGVVRRHPFEIYVTGQASVNAWPKVKCAWGTVCNPHTADAAQPITARTSTFTTLEDSLFWLETVFDADGLVTTCELKQGNMPTPWTDYPEQFTADGLTWYHPIAHIRATLAETPESGEVCIHEEFIIAQLTNTHLRVAQACGTDEAMTHHWKLEPGPGAIV